MRASSASSVSACGRVCWCSSIVIHYEKRRAFHTRARALQQPPAGIVALPVMGDERLIKIMNIRSGGVQLARAGRREDAAASLREKQPAILTPGLRQLRSGAMLFLLSMVRHEGAPRRRQGGGV